MTFETNKVRAKRAKRAQPQKSKKDGNSVGAPVKKLKKSKARRLGGGRKMSRAATDNRRLAKKNKRTAKRQARVKKGAV